MVGSEEEQKLSSACPMSQPYPLTGMLEAENSKKKGEGKARKAGDSS